MSAGHSVRAALAEALDRPPDETALLRDETALFDPPIGLDSLAGARLLAAIHERTGVDVAAEDLGLESLKTLGTLTAFVRARLGGAE